MRGVREVLAATRGGACELGMERDHAAIDPELLLSQTGWVQTLSRSLVRDPLGAEDVAQETLLAALVSPPRYAENVQQLRAWLGRVAFNLAHRATRRSLRQRAREARVARSESLESTAEGVVRTNELQRVTEAVARLEEPYRTAVVLYYFKRLSTARIAEQTGTTDNAVRKRLWRARGQLRSLLDESGERRVGVSALFPWFPAFFRRPLFRRAAGAPRAALFGPAAAVACGALVTVTAVRAFRPDARALAPSADAPVLAAHQPSDLRGGAEARSAAARFEEARRIPASPAAPEHIVDPPLVPPVPPARSGPAGADTARAPRAGRVVDPWGAPVAGVALVRADAETAVLTTSDADGRFTLESAADGVEPPASEALLLAAGAGWMTLRGARLDRAETELLVVAARGAPVRGLVLDDGGAPVAGASLELLLGAELFLELDEPLDLTSAVRRATLSSAAGAFDLGTCVVGAGVRLRAVCANYLPAELALPDLPWPPAPLVVTLHARDGLGPRLTGIVLDDGELPVPDASVRLGWRAATTDREGSFSLPTEGLDPAADLSIEKEGYGRRHIDDFGALLANRSPSSAPLRIHLGNGAHAIRGRILDQNGAPAAGWRVHALETGEAELEELCAAATEWGRPTAGTPTDGDGGFELPGLSNRAYVVVAHDPGSLQHVRSDPLHAGARDVLLRASGGGRMAVRFERADGSALAFARLACEVRFESAGAVWHEMRALGETDRDGRFELPPLPHGSGRLQASLPEGSGQPPGQAAMNEDPGQGEATVVVHETGLLRVVAGPPDEGASFRLLRRAEGTSSESGEEPVLLDDGLAGARAEVQLHGGRSLVLRAPAGTYVGSFLVHGLEIARVQVVLEPGVMTRVRL